MPTGRAHRTMLEEPLDRVLAPAVVLAGSLVLSVPGVYVYHLLDVEPIYLLILLIGIGYLGVIVSLWTADHVFEKWAERE